MTLKSMKLFPLLCLCLLTLSGKTFADERGPAIIKVKQGSDVILPCSLSNKDIERERFEWKKDGQRDVFFYDGGTVDQQLEGRVSHFSDELQYGNASIIIRNTKVTDSGDYTCEFPHLQPRQIFNIELVVEPVIIKVKEGSDVILPCSLSTKENITSKLFDWKKDDQKEVFIYDAGSHYNNGHPGQDEQFKGRVSHFKDELKYGNASIIIRNTTSSDSGDYTCDFPRLQPTQIFNIELVVGGLKDRSGERKGAASKPVTELIQTKDGIMLQCFVEAASIKPTVEWQDSAGNKLPAKEPRVSGRGGTFFFILQTTVTKTDRYRCVATQEEIKHQIHTDIDVKVNGQVIIKVKEDSEVILPCSLSTKENITSTVFDWRKDDQQEVFLYDAGTHYNNGRPGQDQQFKGRVSHFPDELKYGNASIIIRNTKVTDSGHYTCDFPRLQPRQIFNIQLVVGAASKPSVRSIETKNGALLQCQVLGAFPKPTVEWQDSAGNKLPAEEPQVSERGGSFTIILQTTVMKTDNYRCVATQEEIKHQIHTDIDVKVNGPPIGWIVAGVLSLVVVAVVIAVLYVRRKRRNSLRERTKTEIALL